LADVAQVQATLIFYESPKRLAALLTDMTRRWAAVGKAVVCRELTKRFEEVARGTLAGLTEEFSERDVKGRSRGAGRPRTARRGVTDEVIERGA
jgi:16S rRNA (cytidine1402-2'-O)-methyltransferase